MHELLAKVLENRELSKAGQLFNISDWDIVSDLHAALQKLKFIFNSDNYLNDANTQSVVEICLARITSAIRETASIETYSPGLVDLLESCLQHDLTKFGDKSIIGQAKSNYAAVVSKDEDTPYAKIASDLLSCLFLHYRNRSVMTVAIPAAVKVLNSGHKDLIRSTSSYLALAAIDSSRLLAQYSLSIINSITKGNTSLMRVLPQVYAENPAPFHAHFSTLIKSMDTCDPAEKLSLLQLCSMVANNKPELLTAHIWQLRACLSQAQSCTAVLHIFLSLITNGQSAALTAEIPSLKRCCGERKLTATNLATVAKIVAAVGKTSKDHAQDAVCFLLVQCEKADAATMPILLKEVEHVAEHWPLSVRPYLPEIQKLSEQNKSSSSAWLRIRDLCSDDENTRNSLRNLSSSEQLTSTSVLSGGETRSQDTLSVSRRSSPTSLRDSLLQPSTTNVSVVAPAQTVPTQPSNLSKRKSRSSGSLATFRRYTSNNNANNPSATSSNTRSVQGKGMVPLDFDMPIRESPTIRRVPNDFTRKAVRGISTSSGGGGGTYVKHLQHNSNTTTVSKSSAAAMIQQKQLANASPMINRKVNGQVRGSNGAVPSSSMNQAKSPLLDQHPNFKSSAANQNGTITSMITLPVTRPDGTTQEFRYNVQYLPNGRVSLKPLHQRPPIAAQSNPTDPSSSSSPTQQQTTNQLSDRFVTSTNSSVVTTFNARPDHITQRTASGSIIMEEMLNNAAGAEHDNSAGGRPPLNQRTWSHATARKNLSSSDNHNLKLQQNGNGTVLSGAFRTDAVKQFSEKHRSKICDFIAKVTSVIPVPVQCTVEEVGSNGRHRMRVHFVCTSHGTHCLYPGGDRLFAFKTRLPNHWLHLMFLQLQAQQTGGMLGQENEQVHRLKHCWEILPNYVIKNRSFSALVTSAFPTARDQTQLRKELVNANFFDTFTLNDDGRWTCFACSHPEKVRQFLSNGTRQNMEMPVLQGKLKEKRGRWRFFKRWRTKYFTLSSAALTFREDFDGPSSSSHTNSFSQSENGFGTSLTGASASNQPAKIDLRQIRSVRSVSRRHGRKNLPRAFEIFTDDHRSYTFKAQDGSSAEEWLKYLTIAVAQAQRDSQISHL